MANLFKRAAVFTDIHWGLKSNSIQHNTDCSNFVDWFIQEAKRNGCETCFFLGDWNHHRATINIQTLQFGLRALERLNDSFEQVFFIVGNHDLYYKDKRDVHSIEWGRHLPRVHIINEFFKQDDVIITPWLVGDEWEKLKTMQARYLFGHFELPYFYMNAMVEMPDHGELKSEHLSRFERVFSGHFHKRQSRGNITYVGNAFPHNYSDAGDDERGMMILEWGSKPEFIAWPDQPRFRVYNLSTVLDNTDELLQPGMNVRINLDIDVTYEESSYIRETLIPKYQLREMSLIPVKVDLGQDDTDYTNLQFESVDSIIISQIEQLQQGNFDRQLLLDIYRNL